jgi:hypothetical protein
MAAGNVVIPEGNDPIPNTGRALRDLLNTLTDEQLDFKIVLEGCDCNGDWTGAIELRPPSAFWDEIASLYLHRDPKS